jgi:outer membrane usher protein FimD/PapC
VRNVTPHVNALNTLPHRRVLATLISGALCMVASQHAFASGSAPDSVQFDPSVMKTLGIDPSVADYFKHAPRFTPGSHTVTLSVNGNPRGLVSADFDANGNLCVSASLLRQAGLVVPAALQNTDSPTNAAAQAPCYDYRRDFPQTVVDLHPGNNAISLLVPSEAIAVPTLAAGHYTHGGHAALFNYNILATTSHSGGKLNQYKQADTEIGFNVDDWVVRSRQILSIQDGRKTWTHPYAYAQRTLVKEKSVFQAGRINVVGSLFPIAPINGAQLFPEAALATPTGSGVAIQGIAQTRARVEVRQLGALVYSTLVPPGAFTLTNLPLLSGTADLKVTVIEANGAKHGFIVPATTFNVGSTLGAPQGFSMAAGRLQRQVSDTNVQTPWLVTASDGWRWGRHANVSGGALASAPYQALAGGINFAPTAHILTSATVIASHSRGGHEGAQINVAAGTSWTHGLNINATVTQQTAGYRDLSQVLIDTVPTDQWQSPGQPWTTSSAPSWLAGQLKSQYTLGVSWGSATAGNFSASLSHSTTFYGPSVRQMMLSWSHSFGRASVSLNVERDLGHNSRLGNTAYLNVSIPLGRGSLESYVTDSDRALRMGSQFSDSISPMFGYNLEADRDAQQHVTGVGGAIEATPRYTHLYVSASSYGSGNTMFSGQATGGVVIGGGGVTLSPYPIRDTFGVVSLGDDLAGVQIDTPEGPVWTNHHGRAVIASLPEYTTSRIQVATKSLPRNVDIDNGLRMLDPGHGSVNNIGFDVVKVHRALLSTHMDDGKQIPMGGTVVDATRKFITTTGDDGLIFLPNDDYKTPLSVQFADGNVCQLSYTLPRKSDVDTFYSQADAVCKASSTDSKTVRGAP